MLCSSVFVTYVYPAMVTIVAFGVSTYSFGKRIDKVEVKAKDVGARIKDLDGSIEESTRTVEVQIHEEMTREATWDINGLRGEVMTRRMKMEHRRVSIAEKTPKDCCKKM